MKRSPLISRAVILVSALIGHRLWRTAGSADLQGQVVLVTGGSRGLGLLLAREFALQGCQVIICARVQEELEQAQSQLRQWGAQVFTVACDISDQADVNRMIETIMQRYGRVDILVNNAGIIQVTPIQSASLNDFKQAMDTMFWGSLYPTLMLLPHMQARRQGRIVNITSVGGKVPVPHLLPYVAAKYAITGFSEGLTAELSGSGIQVTTIVPGLMRTGSYLNAFFKGLEQDEFRWFSVGNHLPFFSIDAEVAARTIVEAVKRGETEYILTIPAKVLTRFYGLMPNIAIRLLGFAARLVLPAPAWRPSRWTGKEIQSRLREPLLHWLTGWGRSAARRFNQHSAPSHGTVNHAETSANVDMGRR
jgi:NAD(P)-dependent dehydrogenase (short-subunit alcohol dehydrogenase family)